jgi:hypothetical protein
MTTRIVAVTPAGRRRYLELLRHYVCSDPSIAQWQLWDNCRTDEDRIYLEHLASLEPKVKIIRIDRADGTNRSINRFFQFCDDENAFYIRIDDDVVYLPKGFSQQLFERACSERKHYIWWSPLVVNNALCSFLLKHFSQTDIPENLSCQCMDEIGWRDPNFAVSLHRKFLDALGKNAVGRFNVPDFEVSLSRYSVNCISFFGSDVIQLGANFCPEGVDEEEWISAVLPARLHRPGRIIGNVVVAHFSFFPQEIEVLKAGILEQYYKVAGLAPVKYKIEQRPLKQRFLRFASKAKRNLIRA